MSKLDDKPTGMELIIYKRSKHRLIKQDLTQLHVSMSYHFSSVLSASVVSSAQEASKSEALEFFQSCLSSENFQALSALSEIGHYLDAWKSPLSKPLLTRQRELIDILAVASETAQEETKAQGELNEAGSRIRTG